jgi:hypothetical protein
VSLEFAHTIIPRNPHAGLLACLNYVRQQNGGRPGVLDGQELHQLNIIEAGIETYAERFKPGIGEMYQLTVAGGLEACGLLPEQLLRTLRFYAYAGVIQAKFNKEAALASAIAAEAIVASQSSKSSKKHKR